MRRSLLVSSQILYKLQFSIIIGVMNLFLLHSGAQISSGSISTFVQICVSVVYNSIVATWIDLVILNYGLKK